MTHETTSTASYTDPTTDLDELRSRSDVEHICTERAFPPESFENLRARYDAIAGVYQVGITTDDGAVLLVGTETLSLPGGEVLPGEAWSTAARSDLETVLGTRIDIDSPVRVLDGEFYSETAPDERFVAPSVFFEATLREPAASFLDDPAFADDLDHPLYGDGSAYRLGWFEQVPDDVHPNHVDDVELLLG